MNKMNISYDKIIIGEGIPYRALQNTLQMNLYDELNNNVMIPEEYIRDSHNFYFGYNLENSDDEFTNLLSLVPTWDYQPITDNTIAKSKYEQVFIGQYPKNNIDLERLIKEQSVLANIRSRPLLVSATSKFLLSLDPNADLSRLDNAFDEKTVRIIKDVKEIVDEQLHYIDYEFNCEKIFIVVYLNSMPMGGIVIFYNPDYIDDHGSHYIYIQGITKYPVISLIDHLYPEYSIPKLNTILDPIINKIGIDLGAEYVYVKPIGKQGNILQKYYGYNLYLNPSPLKSCKSIHDPWGEHKIYVKKL